MEWTPRVTSSSGRRKVKAVPLVIDTWTLDKDGINGVGLGVAMKSLAFTALVLMSRAVYEIRPISIPYDGVSPSTQLTVLQVA